MKKNRKKKKINLKNLLIYLLKVIVLFLILFYTFIRPTYFAFLYYETKYIYIIMYLIIVYVLGRLNNKNKGFFKKYIKGFIDLLLGLLVCFIIYYLCLGTINLIKKNNFEKFINESDEIIFYNTSSVYFDKEIPTKLLNVDHRSDAILIDYDTMRIGFIFGTFSELHIFKLEEGKLIDSDREQIKVRLKYPGSILMTYYNSEENNFRTSDIEILLQNGKSYTINNIKDKNGYDYYLGLYNMSYDEGNMIGEK